MVSKKDIMQLLTVIGQTYNYFKFPKDDQAENEFMISTWHNLLGHLDKDLLFAALKEHILCETEVPTPAHLSKIIRKITSNNISGNEAYALLLSAISKYGIYRAKEAMESLPKTVQDTVRLMGGIEVFCKAAEGDTYLKNSFIKNYEQATEVQERDMLLPDSLIEQRKALLEKIKMNNVKFIN